MYPGEPPGDPANTTPPSGPTVYGPVGRCIYCGSDGNGAALSDEHIIPLSLGGGDILREASCSKCATITSRLERYCGRELFWELRLCEGFPSRRMKERPKTLPLAINFGERIEQLETPIANFPGTVAFIIWPPPGILFSEIPSEMFGASRVVSWTLKSRLNKTKAPSGAKSARIEDIAIDGRTFARAIAKIAHCHAVSELGLNSFRPFLPEVILGTDPRLSYMIGAEPELLPPAPYRGHYLGWRECFVRGRKLIVVRLRLFPHIGAQGGSDVGPPVYLAVVGEKTV